MNAENLGQPAEESSSSRPVAPGADFVPVPAPAGAPAAPSGAPHDAHVGFLGKLRQHSVGRVAVLYAGVCWVILEPVHVVFHMLGVPEWINRLVVIVMAMGFPIAIVAAWIYVTPAAGLKPDALDAHHWQLGQRNRRLNRAIASIAGIMVA